MSKIITFLKEKAWIACILLVLFMAYSHFSKEPVIKETININNKGNVVEEVKNPNITMGEAVSSETTITAKPKPTINHPDLVVKDTQKFVAEVNGEKFEVKPKDKESFEYGEDYVSIHRTSTINMQVDSKPLEPHFGLGVGVDNRGNPSFSTNVRLEKVPVYFWGASNFKDAHMIGVGIYGNFN